MSQEVRRDLTVIAIAVAMAPVLKLITQVFDTLFCVVDDLHQSIPLINAGEFVAIPLMLALGPACFSYRRYQALGATVAARRRAAGGPAPRPYPY